MSHRAKSQTTASVRSLLAFLIVFAWANVASAALPPEAYDQLRAQATIVFGGVVDSDAGGRAQVRVEHVERGPIRPGQIVTVVYPEERGQARPAGPAVYYRRFVRGMRVRVHGNGAPFVEIVSGGIDVVRLGPGQGRRSGSCGACHVGQSERPEAVWALALLVALGLRRGWR